MRAASIILVAILPFLTGCHLIKLVNYNLWNEPLHTMSETKVGERAVKYADDAWLDHLGSIPENCPPLAYEEGFKHGYADYLIHGGNGAPPAMPPAYYRRYNNFDVEGHVQIKAYYAGFAAGAASAMESGLRVLFVIPVSTTLPAPATRDDTPATLGPADANPAAETLPEPQPVLPEPKKSTAVPGNRQPANVPNAAPQANNAEPPLNAPLPPASATQPQPALPKPKKLTAQPGNRQPANVPTASAPASAFEPPLNPSPQAPTPSTQQQAQPTLPRPYRLTSQPGNRQPVGLPYPAVQTINAEPPLNVPMLPVPPSTEEVESPQKGLPREFSVPILGGPSAR